MRISLLRNRAKRPSSLTFLITDGRYTKVGIKMHNPCLPHKSELDAQLYRFGIQPHFCIAYVIGCIKNF